MTPRLGESDVAVQSLRFAIGPLVPRAEAGVSPCTLSTFAADDSPIRGVGRVQSLKRSSLPQEEQR